MLMSENDSETALWYAVATRARDEAIAKANLQRQDYSVFFAHYQPKKAPPGPLDARDRAAVSGVLIRFSGAWRR